MGYICLIHCFFQTAWLPRTQRCTWLLEEIKPRLSEPLQVNFAPRLAFAKLVEIFHQLIRIRSMFSDVYIGPAM